MTFTLPHVLLFVAVMALVDWVAFAGWVDRIAMVTRRGERSYRDYFFPRILFLCVGGVLVVYGADGGPGAVVALVLGIPTLAISHLIQYYWFVTD